MNKSWRREDERVKGKKKPSTIPVDRIIYRATPHLVRRHVLLPPENKPKSFVRLSSPCAYNTGPSHCNRQNTSPGVTTATPALRTVKFLWLPYQPGATKNIQISFTLLIFVPSHLESGTALLPPFPRTLPLCLRRLYSPVVTPFTAFQPPCH